jgi:hypothetical protein
MIVVRGSCFKEPCVFRRENDRRDGKFVSVTGNKKYVMWIAQSEDGKFWLIGDSSQQGSTRGCIASDYLQNWSRITLPIHIKHWYDIDQRTGHWNIQANPAIRVETRRAETRISEFYTISQAATTKNKQINSPAKNCGHKRKAHLSDADPGLVESDRNPKKNRIQNVPARCDQNTTDEPAKLASQEVIVIDDDSVINGTSLRNDAGAEAPVAANGGAVRRPGRPRGPTRRAEAGAEFAEDAKLLRRDGGAEATHDGEKGRAKALAGRVREVDFALNEV